MDTYWDKRRAEREDPLLSAAKMIKQQSEKLTKEEKEMTNVFVSYHFTTKDGKLNGFGNYIGQFNNEDYKDNLAFFILQLEKEIAKAVEEKINMPVSVKVLYFR